MPGRRVRQRLHPSDVAKPMKQLDGLVEAGNTVIVVEHDMSVASASDWIIDIGPGAGDEDGKIVAAGTPEHVAVDPRIRTAKYLADYILEAYLMMPTSPGCPIDPRARR